MHIRITAMRNGMARRLDRLAHGCHIRVVGREWFLARRLEKIRWHPNRKPRT